MEFGEKLKQLRKQKGLTQEELAGLLFVSRTAISKWESGRGYPSIDTLKSIATTFSVSIDELLTSKKLLNIAEQDQKLKELHFLCLVFGTLDICALLLLVLPFFAQRENGLIKSVSLISLTSIETYLQIIYLISVIAMFILGILTIIFNHSKHLLQTSLLTTALCTIIYITGQQVYVSIFLFSLLVAKGFLILKR